MHMDMYIQCRVCQYIEDVIDILLNYDLGAV